MKWTLRISILLNCVLAALFAALPARNKNRDPLPIARTGTGREIPAAPSAANIPFQWIQIESSDYRQYAANLRAIGCPEQTLREIILADIQDLYAAKRAEMCQGSDDASPWSRREAFELAARIMGNQSELIASSLPEAVAENAAMLPVQDELAPEQKETLEQLRLDFMARNDGLTPDDPDPRDERTRRQAQSDWASAVAGNVGRVAYMKLQAGIDPGAGATQ